MDIKARPIKKIVECRTKLRGCDVLVTVSSRGYRLAMNGPALFRSDLEWSDFTADVVASVRQAQKILDTL